MDVRNRCESLDHLVYISRKTETSRFDYSNMVDLPCLEYLNLFDWEWKRKNLDKIPNVLNNLDLSLFLKYFRDKNYLSYRSFAFEAFDRSNNNTLPIWIQKFKHVSEFNSIPDESREEESYFKYAFMLLDKECENPDIILSLWNTLCITNRSKTRVLAYAVYPENAYTRDDLPKDLKLLQYTLKAANSAKFNFWGALNNEEYQLALNDFNFCPVTMALLVGGYKQMTIFLQHGFEPNFRRLISYDKHFFIVNYLPIESALLLIHASRKALIENISSRRAQIYEVILFLINFFTIRNEETRLNLAQCFHLLWNTLPYPFVTLHELRNEYLQRYGIPNIWIRKGYFDNLLEIYSNLFSNYSINMLQPRSLKYLSKCATRKQLRNCFKLPLGIEELNLPVEVKSYLDVKAYY